MIRFVAACLAAPLIVSIAMASHSFGDEAPLHQLIDGYFPTANQAEFRCGDAEYLRRVSLDLIGMPPTADEARQFLADPSSDKRQRLVDRLLASPHFARHFATTLDLMLMERRAYKHVNADEWQEWLLKSVRENKPWDRLAREILSAHGADAAQRPAARFALDRDAEPHVLTRDIGRIFLGRDMQCAQCHNHPLVDDYLQADYHALQAFVSAGYQVAVPVDKKNITVYGEKAAGEMKFESVFFKGTPHRTGARLPGGLTIEEPFLLPGEEYVTAPADKVRAVPKFSRRAKLAELATNGGSRAFNENIANRLWAHMLGRGLVHPLDLHHPANPATHPELLTKLGERIAAMKFDMKAFLREIALCGVYQRRLEFPAEVSALAQQAAARSPRLLKQKTELEQTAKAAAEAYEKASEAWDKAEAALIPVAAALDTARSKYAAAKGKRDPLAVRLKQEQAGLAVQKNLHTLLQTALTEARKAVAAQPNDKPVADAVAKLKQKTDAVSAAVGKLQAAVNKTTTELKPHTDALAAAKKEIDAALAKQKPIRAAFGESEKAMQAARRTMAESAEALAAHEQRMATNKQLAELPPLDQKIAAAKQSVAKQVTELTSAKRNAAQHAPVTAMREAAVKTAKATADGVAARAAAATKKHTSLTTAAASLNAARTATAAALKQLPGDPALTDVTAKLTERVTALDTEVRAAKKEHEQATAEMQAANKQLADAIAALAAAEAEKQRLAKGVQSASTQLTNAKQTVGQTIADREQLLGELSLKWEQDFTLASLKPLTPEQLCWSIFQVTGVYGRYWQGEVAALDKKQPLTDAQRKDPAALAARDIAVEASTYQKLRGNVGTFVRYYGAGAGQPQSDFFATADQALFAANAGSINSWVVPSGDNVTQRIIKHTDPRQAAEELYLAILTRFPTEAEAQDVTTYLAKRKEDKPAAAQELVWSLLNSVEFRFNH